MTVLSIPSEVLDSPSSDCELILGRSQQILKNHRFNRAQRKICGFHFRLALMRLNSFESFRIADL